MLPVYSVRDAPGLYPEFTLPPPRVVFGKEFANA
jgi:hypothetical protein